GGVCTGERVGAGSTDSATLGGTDTLDTSGATGAEARGDSLGAASSDLRTGAVVDVDADGATVELGTAGEDVAGEGRNGVIPVELVEDGATVAAVLVFTWAAGLLGIGATCDAGLLTT